MEGVGEQVGQGYYDDGLAEQGKEDRVIFFTQGFEGRLAAVLEHHKNKSGEINIEAGQGRLLQDRIGAEDPQHEHGKQPHHAPDDDTVGKAHGKHDLAGVQDVAHAPRAVIVAHYGGGAFGKRQQRSLEHLARGVDHGHGRHIDVAAHVGQDAVAADGDQAVGELHDEGRHA